jgi:hypothetical protein
MDSANITGVDFIATSTTTYSISGSVRVPSATVSYSGTASGSAIADSNGNYSIESLTNGSYTITPPIVAGYLFSPSSLSETISGASISNANFTVSIFPTPGTVILGKFSGAGNSTAAIVQSAFPQSKGQTLDLIQIIDPGSGVCVWNLNHLGIVNSTNPSPTNGTVLGVFLGSSWTECFIENNSNPYQLDLIQIVNIRGGGCLWKLDYTGTVYSVN